MIPSNYWTLGTAFLFTTMNAFSSDVTVMLGNAIGLDGTKSMCDMYQETDDLSCEKTTAPVHSSIIGKRAECLNTAPYSYSSQDEVIIFLDQGSQHSFKYRFHGLRQSCQQAVNIEVSVDGEWHNLGMIDPTPQGQHEIISITCEGPGCQRPRLAIDAFRVCDSYSGDDCD